MKTLVPIGRFSAICRLSQKALRLYDEMGLLRPAWVDPDSGYRYYAVAQAVEAERIRLLRSLEVVYAALQRWIQEHGHECADAPREIYLVGPQQVRDPAELRTEIQWPIR